MAGKGTIANLKPFKPGQSGNPGGKPKGHEELRELARSYTVEAVKTLGTIMKNAKVAASSRVTAATVLLERGWGKPVQTVEVKRTPFDELTPAEIRAIGEALETVAGDEGGYGAGGEAPAVSAPPLNLQSLQ